MQPVAKPSLGLRHIAGAPIVSSDEAEDHWRSRKPLIDAAAIGGAVARMG
jgi:hypothetical protein